MAKIDEKMLVDEVRLLEYDVVDIIPKLLPTILSVNWDWYDEKFVRLIDYIQEIFEYIIAEYIKLRKAYRKELSESQSKDSKISGLKCGLIKEKAKNILIEN